MLKTTIGLWMLALGFAACGGGADSNTNGAGGGGTTGGTTGGPIPCALASDPDSGRVACPGGSPKAEDAIATLTDLRKIADGTGETVKWLGGVLGQQLARDGTPTGGPLSIWTAGFCLGGTGPSDIGDGLNLSTNGTECLAQNNCESLDCSQSPDYPFPKVDASAAIATAFPSDPAGTTYHVGYTAAIGDFWTIGSSASTTAVKIDATTGAVVP